MDDKTAAQVLLSLLARHKLNEEEKRAVEIAIGILGWTKLAKARIKAIKTKKLKAAAEIESA